jgi:hypothetical protein
VLDEREHLERLAQTHVVGQDPAEPVLAQEGEPPEALELVGAQRRRQAVGDVRTRHLVEVAQGGGPLHPGRGPHVHDAELRQLGPGAEVARADAQPARLGLAELRRERHRLVEPGELRSVEGHVGATRQDQELLVTGDRGQHVGQRHLLAVDAHEHLEVEPVGVVGLRLGQDEGDLGCRGRLPEVGRADLLDVEVGERTEVRQVVEGEGERVPARGGRGVEELGRHVREDRPLGLGVAQATEGVPVTERRPLVAVDPGPVEVGVRGGPPGHRQGETGPRGRRHLHGPVGRLHPEAPDDGRERLEEGLALVRRGDDGTREDELHHGVVARLGQLRQDDVVALDERHRGGRPPDRHDLVRPPAPVDAADRDLQGGPPVDVGEVGDDRRRLRGDRHRRQSGASDQGDAPGEGLAQGRHQAVAVVVEHRGRPGDEVGVPRDQAAVQRLQGVDLRRDVAGPCDGTGEVAPLGTAARPTAARAGAYGSHRQLAGRAARPARRRSAGDLEAESLAAEGRPRPRLELVGEPGQLAAPHRLRLRRPGHAVPGRVRDRRGGTKAQRDRRPVLAHPPHGARARAEDPVGGGIDLGVELDVVGGRGGAADGGGGGQAGVGLVDDRQVLDRVGVGPGAGQCAEVEEPGEVGIGERVADVHVALIVSSPGDSGPLLSTAPGTGGEGGCSGLSARRPAPTARRRSRGWRGGRG